MKIKVTIDSLHHDGELIPQGSLLELPKEQAQALVDASAAVPVDLNGAQTPVKPAAKAKPKGGAGSATTSKKPAAPSKALPAAEAEA